MKEPKSPIKKKSSMKPYSLDQNETEDHEGE